MTFSIHRVFCSHSVANYLSHIEYASYKIQYIFYIHINITSQIIKPHCPMKSKRLSWIVGVFKEEIKDIGSKIDSAMCLLPQLDGPKCKWWARVIRPPSS